MVNKYGADALRLYLINSPVVRIVRGVLVCLVSVVPTPVPDQLACGARPALLHTGGLAARGACLPWLHKPANTVTQNALLASGFPSPLGIPTPSGAGGDAQVQGGGCVCGGQGRLPALVQRIQVRGGQGRL